MILIVFFFFCNFIQFIFYPLALLISLFGQRLITFNSHKICFTCGIVTRSCLSICLSACLSIGRFIIMFPYEFSLYSVYKLVILKLSVFINCIHLVEIFYSGIFIPQLAIVIDLVVYRCLGRMNG